MAKIGHSVFRPQRRSTDVLGARIHLVPTGSGDAITRHDTSVVVQHHLGVGDRQARRAMTLYGLEDWPAPNSGPSMPFGLVNSVEARVQSHAARTYETRIENGRRGGRPTRPPLDQAPGSTGLMNQSTVEAVVAAPQDDEVHMWTLPHSR